MPELNSGYDQQHRELNHRIFLVGGRG